MYEGCKATLQMQSVFREEMEIDPGIYVLQVKAYERQEEKLYLILKNADLTELSLDAVYKCRIEVSGSPTACEGIVKERYCNKDGNTVVFKVENGFYE